MFLNYIIAKQGHRSIYLGPSVPIENLIELKNYYNDINFVSYFTIKPEEENISKYLKEFDELILSTPNTKLWILGNMIKTIDKAQLPNNITTFNLITDLTEELKNNA